MKIAWSILLLISLCLPTAMLVATKPQSVLTNVDLNKISGKKQSDQAWKNLSKLLRKLIVMGIGASIISSVVPTGIHSCKLPVYQGKKYFIKENGWNCCDFYTADFDDDTQCTIPYPSFTLDTKTVEYCKEVPAAHHKPHRTILIKPYVVAGSISATLLLVLLDLIVTKKRALDHEKNMLTFLLTDLFAK